LAHSLLRVAAGALLLLPFPTFGHPGSYTNRYTVETPFPHDLGKTVILGGWVKLSGTDNGKPFEQKARFADIWHRGAKGWQRTFTQVTLADHP
jgi:hypothetical protein